MRLTIERLRTLVLVTGGLVVVALVAFLVVGHWRNKLNLREIPKRLGVDIKQEANGVTYTQAHGGHTLFKIHASKVVQLAQGNRALLHDVQIELYSVDGKTVDRIVGNEFEYDQKAGTAKATGPVEILIERPGVAPAIAPNAAAGKAAGNTPLASVANGAASGQIDVKTSGLTFDQKSGIATTPERVRFSTLQGDGTSIGATFDSDNGQLVLDRDVELNAKRGTAKVLLRAQHAEFARLNLICRMRNAVAHYDEGEASAGDAVIHFRVDGTAEHLDAGNGFVLTTANGEHVDAPMGTMDFDEKNRPQHGHLQGGVTLNSSGEDRQMHGSAPTAELTFTERGELKHLHLVRGVAMHTEQTTITEGSQPALRARRDWQSPVADIDFRSARKGRAELALIRGTGGVVIASETQRGDGAVTPSRMAADTVTGQFGDGQQLTQMIGDGHASLAQTTAAGTRQTTTGDRLEVHFAKTGLVAPAATMKPKKKGGKPVARRGNDAGEIESATVDGNVVMTQTPAPKPGEAPVTLTATAERADYEGASEWLHLTGNPRIDDAGLQLNADRVDVSQSSGDAFARGNVKATWIDQDVAKKRQTAIGLGGKGPAHVIAAEAQLHKATGEATFRGNARLWQDSNSVAAPVIVLNQTRQTLAARGAARDPVRIVLLSAGSAAITPGARRVSTGDGDNGDKGKERPPSVVRVKAADLKYSEAERKAVLRSGDGGRVEADTGGATTTSNEAELVMLPPGNHAGPNGESAQVDRLIARGHVTVNSMGRSGVGEQLAYSSDTGEYALTGTPANPPQFTDPAHGTVSGDVLIFSSRDDSVSIEGQGQKTSTQTTAPN